MPEDSTLLVPTSIDFDLVVVNKYLVLVTISCAFSALIPRNVGSDAFESRYTIMDSASSKNSTLIIECRQSQVLSIMVVPHDGKEQQLPRFPMFRPENQHHLNRKFYTLMDNCHVDIHVDNRTSSVTLKRKGTDNVFFELKRTTFEQGHHVVQTVEDSLVYGLGERFQEHFQTRDGSWSMWNRDRPWEIDEGSHSKSAQTYGFQPVYLARENASKQFHLTYFKTVYAMNVVKQGSNLTYNVVNGNAHFLIFIGSSNPEQLIQKYHTFIGAGLVPPFWAMGFHQCRWGYPNIRSLQNVITNHDKHSIPLDTVWNDLDYMNEKQDFTVNQSAFPLQQMKEDILSTVHYIPLIDAGVSVEQEEAYKKGNSMDVFIKHEGSNYIGTVWPGRTSFVDFLHPNASEYWSSMFQELYSKIKFSGVWLDMNEISDFQGNADTFQTYRVQHNQRLTMMTINLNCTHFNSQDFTKPLLHSQVHSYYGHLMAEATNKFLQGKGLRPFIITRSNAVGTGVYASHWTGDNVANWRFLRLSISGNFLYQIFGMQMVGADICGFHLNTTAQLCSRWMQLGAFYPFSRNHNEKDYIPQEAYALGDSHLKTSKMSLDYRYSLLKQYYTVFVKSKGTGSVYRPLNFQFPQDEECYKPEYLEEQFMIGSVLMGVPILQQGQTSKRGYFPEGWFGFQNGQIMRGVKSVNNTLPAPPSLFVREGKMVFVNDPKTRTKHLDNNFTIKIGLKKGQGVYISQGDIMSLGDYQNNAHIQKCIKGGGCFYKVQAQLTENTRLKLSWEYIGHQGLDDLVFVKSVEIFREDRAKVQRRTEIEIRGTGSVTIDL